MIIAFCERCDEFWYVPKKDEADTLEGHCMDCQSESEVAERSLHFYRLPVDIDHVNTRILALPSEWLVR